MANQLPKQNATKILSQKKLSPKKNTCSVFREFRFRDQLCFPSQDFLGFGENKIQCKKFFEIPFRKILHRKGESKFFNEQN